MKFTKYLIILLIPLFYLSCTLEPVTIEQRIDSFLSDLNNDSGREIIYKNLHPNIQDTWKSNTTWLGMEFDYDNQPFSLYNLSYDTTTSGKLDDKQAFGQDIVFYMQENEANVWYIKKITVDGSNVIY